ACQLSAAPAGCGLASGSAPVHSHGASRSVLDSSIVEEVNAMRSPRQPSLWGCTVMALAVLVFLPAAGQAKGSHSHSKKQAPAAYTKKTGPQLPQATSPSPTPSPAPSPSSVGVIAPPAPPPPPTPAAVIGAPSPQQHPPTPLSTPLTLTTPAAGGNARTDS